MPAPPRFTPAFQENWFVLVSARVPRPAACSSSLPSPRPGPASPASLRGTAGRARGRAGAPGCRPLARAWRSDSQDRRWVLTSPRLAESWQPRGPRQLCDLQELPGIACDSPSAGVPLGKGAGEAERGDSVSEFARKHLTALCVFAASFPPRGQRFTPRWNLTVLFPPPFWRERFCTAELTAASPSPGDVGRASRAVHRRGEEGARGESAFTTATGRCSRVSCVRNAADISGRGRARA